MTRRPPIVPIPTGSLVRKLGARASVMAILAATGFASVQSEASAVSLSAGGTVFSPASAGGAETCAVKNGGSVFCWGVQMRGSLGFTSGSANSYGYPGKVPGLAATSVSVGGVGGFGVYTPFVCAMTTAGGAKCWGANASGNLGDGTTTDSEAPVQVAGLDGSTSAKTVTQIAAGPAHACAVLQTGAVNCWGYGGAGELGANVGVWKQYPNDGLPWWNFANGRIYYQSSPVAVYGIDGSSASSTAVSIDSGGDNSGQTCIALANGTVNCWGRYATGQGGNDNSYAPVAEDAAYINGSDAAHSAVRVAVGAKHACALMGNGAVRCWGGNLYGQLGDGSIDGSSASTSAVQLSAGGDQTCVLLESGTPKCWGSNNYRALGNLTDFDGSTPAKKVVSITAGYDHTCAVVADGTVRCWGRNQFAQLGNGAATDPTTNASATPVTAYQLSGVSPLAAPVVSSALGSFWSSKAGSVSISGESGATFECSLDGAAYGGCSSPVSLTGLAEGAHTLNVRQTDSTGTYVSGSGDYSWTVDTVAPVIGDFTFTTPQVTATNRWTFFPQQRTVDTSPYWESSSTFSCRLVTATSTGDWTPCTNGFEVTDLADGMTEVSLVQIDAAGNRSAQSATQFVVNTDTTVPSAPTLDGAPAANTSSTGISVSITGLDTASLTYDFTTGSPWTSAHIGVEGLQFTPWKATFSSRLSCKLDSGSYTTCTSPFTASGLAQGSHTLSVRQVNPVGTVSSASTAEWNVDSIAPSKPSLGNVPASRVNFGNASITYSGEAGATFECKLDSADYAACGGSPVALSGLAEGSHTFSVRQTDLVGNVSEPETANWTVDTTPPDAPVLSGAPESSTRITSASIGFTGEVGATFTCKVDDGAYETCGSSPKVLTGLSLGAHSLSVKATDLAGNTGTAASAAWTVFTTAPDAPVVAKPLEGGSFLSGETVPFSASSEAGSALECNLDDAGWVPCPVSYTPGDGSTVSVGWATRLIFGQVPFGSQVKVAQLPEGEDSALSVGKDYGQTFAESQSWDSDCASFPSGDLSARGTVLNADGTDSSLMNLFTLDCGITSKYSTGDLLQDLPVGSYGLKVRATRSGLHSADISVAFGITEGPPYLYEFHGAEATILGCRNDVCPASLSIPATIDGKSVTSIAKDAFAYSSTLQSITIPVGVTSIGDRAFQSATGLTSVTLPATLTTMGDSAFGGATGLTSIEIPDGVTSIPNGAFFGAEGLASIKLPAGLTSIGSGAFNGTYALTGIDIPAGVTTIGSGAFVHATGLTSIKLPAGVTSIGENTFSGATALTSVEIPAGLTTIGDGAFAFASALTSLKLPAGLTSIGQFAFINATGLTSLKLPAGLTSIGDAAFSGASGLTTIDIPAGVTSIGGQTFLDASGLTSIKLPASLTSIGDYAFNRASSLATVVFRGDAPTVGTDAFTGVASGARAFAPASLSTFGTLGDIWNGLILSEDAVAPDTPGLADVPDALTNNTSASIGFTGEAGATFACKLDGGAYEDCGGSPKVLSDLAAGAHSLSVKQIDLAGNTSLAASASWTVQALETTSPTLESGSVSVGKPTVLKGSGYELTGVVGSAPSPVFQWHRCTTLDDASSCSAITGSAGANGAWWGTRDADIGYQLRLSVSWSTVQGVKNALSALSGLVTPSVTEVPVITFGVNPVGLVPDPTPVKGVKQHSSFGRWAGYIGGLSSVAFEWQTCTSGTDDSSCSASSTSSNSQWYTPTAADVGQYLRSKATITTRGQTAVGYSTMAYVRASRLLCRHARVSAGARAHATVFKRHGKTARAARARIRARAAC